MNRRQEAAGQRVEVAFPLYHQLGPERSLKRLHRQLQSLDVPIISLATLKRYSQRFCWQSHIAELNAEAARRQRLRARGGQNRQRAPGCACR